MTDNNAGSTEKQWGQPNPTGRTDFPSSPPLDEPTSQDRLAVDPGQGWTNAQSTDSTAPSGHRKIWIAGVAALVLLGVVGAFAIRSFPKSGANSPEDAIERFSEAALTQDWLNIVFMIEPTERRVLLDRIDDIQKELVRLEVVDESEADMKSLGDTADLTVSDLVTSVEPVNDDIYRGWIDSAHVTGSYDLSKTPQLAEMLNIAESDTVDNEISTRDEKMPLALVERDGKWYVSVWYSFAENMRLQTDSPPPDPAERLNPIGGESPEEAATALIESIVDLDLSASVAMMDPLELGAVYDYWSLYGTTLDEFGDLAESFIDEVVRVEVSDLEWDTKTDGDDAWVTLRAGRLTITSVEPGMFDLEMSYDQDESFITIAGSTEGSPFDMRMEWDDSTMTIVGNVEGEPVDLTIEKADGDKVTITGVGMGESVDVDMVVNGDCLVVSGTVGSEAITEETCEPGLQTNIKVYLDGEGYPQYPTRMRRVDDRWYFSPTSTMIDAMIMVLQRLEPGDVDDLEAAVENGIERGESVAGGNFDFQEETTEFGDFSEGFLEEDDTFEADAFEEDSSVDDEEFTFDGEALTDEEEEELMAGAESLADMLFGPEQLGATSTNTEEVLDTDLGGTLEDGTYDEVTIVVTSAPVTVEVSSDDFDTVIEIIDADSGATVGVNDDTGASSNSAVTIDEPGSYTVNVHSFERNGGDYSLMVSAGE